MFFGALVFAASASFVGCQDYDDDIDKLQGQIDKIASSLTDLQSQVGSYVKSVTYDAATGQLTVVNGDKSVSYDIAPNLPTYTISVGADGKVSLLKDGVEVSSGNITFPAGAVAFDPSKLTVDPVTKKIMYNGQETGVTMPTDGVLSIEDKKNADGVTIGYTITYKGQSVTFALNDVLTLKGLVFKSTLFVDGVEAVEYPYLNYNYLKSAPAAGTGWNDEQTIPCKVTEAAGEWNYVGDGVDQFNPIEYASYHLNPSSAKVNKEDLSFVSRDVEMVSSRASVAAPVVADMKAADEGILPVGFTAEGKLIAQGGEGSIMALQAIVKAKSDAQADTTVTSDYALLYASRVTPMAIAFNDKTIPAVDCTVGANPDELYKSVEAAIKNAPSMVVAYNSALDLKQYLTTHYNQNGEPKALKSDGDHKVWAYGDEAKFGLKYDFMFIQYTTGSNVTSDSKYADAATIATGIVTPRIVDANGTTLGEQGVSSVGKRPLVRVRVTDAEGRVVLYGFIKINIVKQIDDITTTEFNKGTHHFGCDRADLKLTWSEISYQLLEKAAVSSKADFDALYIFDVEPINKTGVQYVKVKVGDKFNFVKATADQLIGFVEEKVDETGTTNTVLHWNVEKTEQQDIYEMNAEHKATIYVRYISKVGASNAPIYMPLTVAVDKPEGTVTEKIAEYWFGDNKGNTRLNVAYPKDNGSAAYHDYTIDLNQVWVGNMPKFNPTKDFASFTDAIFAHQYGGFTGGYKYYFAADQAILTVGKVEYTLSVDATTASCITGGAYEATPENMVKHALSVNSGVFTNVSLYAAPKGGAKVKIATINQNDGTITYANNATSKILLNAFDHSVAAHFANIGVTAYSPCGVAMSLDNAVYPAYFLRPIDPISVTTGEFIDAQANGSTLDIAKLFDFQDWRNVKFVDGANYGNSWLYAYYELSNVKVDFAKVTTTLNGGSLDNTLLSSITSKIELNQTDNAGNKVTSSNLTLASYNNAAAGVKATYDEVVKQMGKIKYVNNGNNVQDFQLRIPVDFTYYWGTINTYVDVTVKGTMGN